MKQQEGFTLIELVVVMVLLGIMAAFAVSKFYSFSSQAYAANLNGLAAALSSANVTAHAAALATNQTGASGTITMEGSSAVTLAYGYPAGTAAGIGAAVVYPSTGSGGFSVTYAGGVATFTMTGNTNSNCNVVYTAASTATGATAVATVAATTSGC